MVAGPVEGHSSLLVPPPRNAVDRGLPQWAGGRFGYANCSHPAYEKPNPLWGNGSCWGCDCVNSTGPCEAAQTCLWFSDGSSIGCAKPDGGASNPNYRDRCDSGKRPTNNDPYFRTVNRTVTAMSKEDLYQHNPWRAPGSAPVFDACGMAGGSVNWTPTQLSYIPTKFAKQGALGSVVLPQRPTGIVWRAGDVAEAKWAVRANHGGGYSYRLCPAGEELTEACFKRHPLPFAGRMALEFGNGTRIPVEGRYLVNGTEPAGSMWAMNPLPFKPCYADLNATDPLNQGCSFEPPCTEAKYSGPSGWLRFPFKCSGRFPVEVSIVDWLRVPQDTPPGDYVLGFRYDCEMTSQVWSSCADIQIA